MKRLFAVGGFRVYHTRADRKRAIAQLKLRGFNYFYSHADLVDPDSSFGLSFGKCELTAGTTVLQCWL